MIEKFFGTRGKSPEGEGKTLEQAIKAVRDTDEFKHYASIITATERVHGDAAQEEKAFVALQEKLKEAGYAGEVTTAQVRNMILPQSNEPLQ